MTWHPEYSKLWEDSASLESIQPGASFFHDLDWNLQTNGEMAYQQLSAHEQPGPLGLRVAGQQVLHSEADTAPQLSPLLAPGLAPGLEGMLSLHSVLQMFETWCWHVVCCCMGVHWHLVQLLIC